MIGATQVPMEWWDWSLANVLSIAQVALTAIGFLFALLQLRRTATAAESSAALLGKLRVRMVTNDLMVALPDLHDLEDQMDAACSGGVPAEVERVLVLYSRKGGEILGIMEAQADLKDDPLAKALRQAVVATGKAKAEISEGADRGLLPAAAVARRRIAAVSHEASLLRARLQREAE